MSLRRPEARSRVIGGASRLALLHFDPRPGEVFRNIARLEQGIAKAADTGAAGILTPELATTGYAFHKAHGVEWIGDRHDAALLEIARMAADRDVAVFLGAPERDEASGKLFNAIKVFDGRRGCVGSHRKVNALRVGSEAWSSPGSRATVLQLEGFGRVGLMICADACSRQIAVEMKAMGVDLIFSSANWAPGDWGPQGEWERVSQECAVPVFVCNRTGHDGGLSFEDAESIVASNGVRLISVASTVPVIVLIDWDLENNEIVDWFCEPF